MDCNFNFILSRNDIFSSVFCAVEQPMFPFSIVPMLVMLLVHASRLPFNLILKLV